MGSVVDADKSGSIGKGEFAEVIAFFCLNLKLKSASEMLQLLKDKPPYTDYDGAPFRLGGSTRVHNGFELTAGRSHQEGHFLCTHPFDATAGEIYVKLEYQAYAREQHEFGEGICIYLCNPDVEGWDTHFDGSGPVGFQG